MKKIAHTTKAGGAKAKCNRVTSVHLVSDGECTMEAIHRRADHLGPVMAGILHEMEEHWMDHRHLDGRN
jgi:hypothetical protein